MKKVLSTIAVMGLVIAATSTTAYAHGHGGSHHSSGRSQVAYTAPAPVYTAPAQTTTSTIPLVAAVCGAEGCAIIGEHTHDNVNIVTHYYGDGHDYHDEYDHYYGDGHDYHDQYDHYYGDGHCHTAGDYSHHTGEYHH